MLPVFRENNPSQFSELLKPFRLFWFIADSSEESLSPRGRGATKVDRVNAGNRFLCIPSDPVRPNAGAWRDRAEGRFSSFLFSFGGDDYSCNYGETWLACMGAMFYDSNVRRSYGGPIPEAIWKIYSAQAFGSRRNG
jgi:hypothetical protein